MTARFEAAVRGRGLLLASVALLLLLTAAYAFSAGIRASRGASITGDEPFYLLTTQSILQDRDLDLRNQYEARSYERFFDHPDGLWRQSVPTDGGRLLSPHNPGLSVLVIPGYVSGGLAGVHAQLMVIAAAAMALAFVLADRLTGRRAISWIATLGVGLTAVPFIYSTEIYPEFPAAAALLVSLIVVARSGRLTSVDALWTACALSALCWLGVKYAPLALLVSTYFLFRSDVRGRGRLTLLGLGIGSAAVYAWFHLITFDGLTPYGVGVVHAGFSTPELIGSHLEVGDRFYRLWGLFLDRRFGIGRWAPVLILALPGLVLMARGRGPCGLVLGLIATQLMIAAFAAITMMGWWFPGRTLMVVLPLFALPLALLVVQLPEWSRTATAALGLYSVAVTAALARAGHAGEVTIAVDPFDMDFPPFQWMAWLFPDYTSWTLETWALTVFWLALAAASVLAVMRPGEVSVVPSHPVIGREVPG